MCDATEFCTPFYDGGGGSGWRIIGRLSPHLRSWRRFHWDLADEGIARPDRGGAIDVFSTYAPDGIVGPHEKGWQLLRDSRHVVAVQIATPDLGAGFDGTLRVTNSIRLHSASQVRFQCSGFGSQRQCATRVCPPCRRVARRMRPGPVDAHGVGTLKLELPKDWRDGDALMLTPSAR